MKINHDRTFGHIDRSTGDASPHVEKKYTLQTHFEGELVELWSFFLPMPVRIADALSSADWEETLVLFQRKMPNGLSAFESLLLYLRVQGKSPEDVRKGINSMVGRALYHKFVMRQIKEGNRAWIAPTGLSGSVGEPA